MKNKDKVSHWGNSLRYLSWDKYDHLTDSEQLISDTVHEWYDSKHSAPSESEIRLINQINITSCPYCGGSNLKKNGHYRSGIQEYKCLDCGKDFSPLTNTIFADRKIPIAEWIEYLLSLFEFHSIRSSSRDNRNANSTGKYWLLKIFAILNGIQNDVVLNGNVWIDETLMPVIKHDVVTKDGKKLRGNSRNKIDVATGVDEHGHILLISENTSKPSMKSTWLSYGSHIKPGSHLIHDDENTHHILVERLDLTEEIHPTKETKGMSDDENPLDPVNEIHMYAKRYIRAHGGYDRKRLQDWLNLIWFILSDPVDRYAKVNRFLELALNSPIRMKYRDTLSKKDDE